MTKRKSDADKAQALVDDPEFEGLFLAARNGKVVCLRCNDEKGYEPERKVLRQHCFGAKGKGVCEEWKKLPEEDKRKLGHYDNVFRWNAREAQRIDTMMVRQQVADAQFKRMREDDDHSRRIARRVEVHRALLQAGVKLKKLDNKSFRKLIEGTGEKISRRALSDKEVIDVVDQQMDNELSTLLGGRLVSIFFDGATNNMSVEVVVARIVTDDGWIQYRALSLIYLDATSDAAAVKGLLAQELLRRSVAWRDVVVFECDSAAVNQAGLRAFNREISQYDEANRLASSAHVILCMSHGGTNSANKLVNQCELALRFMRGMKGLRKSKKARAFYLDICGEAMPNQTENRWLYWHKMAVAIVKVWPNLRKFVKSCMSADVMPKKVAKLKSVLLDNDERLQLGLELNLLASAGKPLATFVGLMEGDGFLSPFAYEKFNAVSTFMDSIRAGVTDGPMFDALRSFHETFKTQFQQPRYRVDELITGVWRKRLPMIEHWNNNKEKWAAQLRLFRGLSLLDPYQLLSMSDPQVSQCLSLLQEEEVPAEGKIPRSVCGLKGVSQNVVQRLRGEIPTLRLLAEKEKNSYENLTVSERRNRLWRWWWSIREEIPSFYFVAERAVLVLPSSAPVERFFSVLKGSTTKTQTREKIKTMERRGLELYNARESQMQRNGGNTKKKAEEEGEAHG